MGPVLRPPRLHLSYLHLKVEEVVVHRVVAVAAPLMGGEVHIPR